MKLAYIDACIWIGAVEGLPVYQQQIDQHLRTLTDDGWQYGTSELVKLEVLIKPFLNGQEDLARQYQQLLGTLKLFKTPPQIFTQALQIARAERLKAIDAMHVALATHARCQLFVSTDPAFQQLKSITPYWIDLSASAPA